MTEVMFTDMSALEDGLEETAENKSFSKPSFRGMFHGLGSFGKGKLKLRHRPSVLNEVGQTHYINIIATSFMSHSLCPTTYNTAETAPSLYG